MPRSLAGHQMLKSRENWAKKRCETAAKWWPSNDLIRSQQVNKLTQRLKVAEKPKQKNKAASDRSRCRRWRWCMWRGSKKSTLKRPTPKDEQGTASVLESCGGRRLKRWWRPNWRLKKRRLSWNKWIQGSVELILERPRRLAVPLK